MLSPMHSGSESAYKLVRLSNGTNAVHSVAERETMHPVLGPMAEAETLYLTGLRLPERVSRAVAPFVVWDVGLGAAANVLALLRALGSSTGRLRIVSFDRTTAPLAFALEHCGELGYFTGFESQLETLLRNQSVRFSHRRLQVEWTSELGDFPALLASRPGSSRVRLPAPDAILFDPFSPAKNPSMWTAPLFADLFQWLQPDRPCALTTYSRSTSVRVALLLAGLYVGTGRGVGSKEETTVAANACSLLEAPLDLRWLRRARRSHAAEPLREARYCQAPLSPETWFQLQRHPQFLPNLVSPG